jgi:hypothetical protein
MGYISRWASHSILSHSSRGLNVVSFDTPWNSYAIYSHLRISFKLVHLHDWLIWCEYIYQLHVLRI